MFLLNSIPVNDPIFFQHHCPQNFTLLWFILLILFYIGSFLSLFVCLLEELIDLSIIHFSGLGPPHVGALSFSKQLFANHPFLKLPFSGSFVWLHLTTEISSLVFSWEAAHCVVMAYLRDSPVPSFPRKGHPWGQRVCLTFLLSFSIMVGKILISQ